ncbi:VOC family protein [Allonocardiopsis opalescens]|uniref:VOC domain-containing protein n=1 Tax=Allonocardiopsis opalescens TaxID=1144618 RepID=A0A2T0QEY4_9ACTN|nr:VOC family protein [Allonocardiopsis opalescens]PRY02504.1 hypothetical protein CLV72_1011106 [Allonocardiopsis opalescens]
MLTTDYVPGAPNWVDLGTRDVEGAAGFYRALFGWGFRSAGAGGYGFFLLDGRVVAGVGPLDEEGARAGWTLYFHSADVDATAGAVERAGGSVRTGPLDVLAAGRTAACSDPAGARFALWRPGERAGLDAVGAPNTLWWTQLYVLDVPAARDFYRSVFAWETEDLVLVRGAAYTVVAPAGGPGGPHGGIMALTELPAEVSAGLLGWHPYFAVADCDAAVAAAVAHGGTVAIPAETAAGVGRQATLRDPAGALFSVNASAAG